jgi:hypothetical protein
MFDDDIPSATVMNYHNVVMHDIVMHDNIAVVVINHVIVDNHVVVTMNVHISLRPDHIGRFVNDNV